MTRELVNLDGKVMEVSEALIYLNNKILSTIHPIILTIHPILF